MKLNHTVNNSWMDEYCKSEATPLMYNGMIGDCQNYFSKECPLKWIS